MPINKRKGLALSSERSVRPHFNPRPSLLSARLNMPRFVRPRLASSAFRRPRTGRFSRRSRLPRVPRLVAMRPTLKKWQYLPSPYQSIDNTGVVKHLNAVAQGISDFQRLGKKLTNYALTYHLDLNNNTAAVNNFYAIYLIWDKAPNKVLPIVADVLEVVDYRAMIKTENQERFTVLRSHKGVLTGYGGSGSALTINGMIKFPTNSFSEWTSADTTGVIADAISGSIYLVAIGNNVAGTAACFVTSSFDFSFTDL